MPQRVLEAGDEFAHAEGLRHVVVGPELQRFDDTCFVGAAGQDDDWYGLAGGAPAGEELLAGGVREAEVEDHEIGGTALVVGLGGGAGLADVVALGSEAGAQQAADRRLVIDDRMRTKGRSCRVLGARIGRHRKGDREDGA